MSGQVFLIDDAGAVVARLSAPLLKAQAERDTDKICVTTRTNVGGVNCAVHPFDMNLYAFALSVNTYHRRACAVKAHDIAGRGWDLVSAQTDREGNPKAGAEIRAFLDRPHPRMSLANLLENCEKDFQGLGNAYLEVRRNAAGQPGALEHYPAPTMWVRVDQDGYIQRVNEQHAYLKPFGDPEQRLVPGTSEAQNEMIHLADYDPGSLVYGLPCIISAFGRLALMQLELEYNSQFFGNNAIGRWAVVLEGDWDPDAEEKIREYYQSKVRGQAHRTLVMTSPTGCKVTFQRLDTDAKDSQFRFLRQDSRDEILQAHGVPPLLVGVVETGALGGNVGSEQLKQYRDSVVLPGRERWEAALDSIIEAGWPGCGWVFRFQEYSIDDQQQNATIDNTYLVNRVLTPNEVRARRFPDLGPLPDEYFEAPAGDVLMARMEELQKALRELRAAGENSENGKTRLNAPGSTRKADPVGFTRKCLLNIFERGSVRNRAGSEEGPDV